MYECKIITVVQPQSLSRAELRKMRSVSSEDYAKTKLSMPAYAPQIKQRELHEVYTALSIHLLAITNTNKHRRMKGWKMLTMRG